MRYLTRVLVIAFLFIPLAQVVSADSSSPTILHKWGVTGVDKGNFSHPGSVAADSMGNVYVVDTDNFRIQKFNTKGEFIIMWGSHGTGDGQFVTPNGIAVDSKGDIYVADTYNHRIQKFTSKGKFIAKWGTNGDGNGQFLHPMGLTVDSKGNIYVADASNSRIQKFDTKGKFITKWGSVGTATASSVHHMVLRWIPRATSTWRIPIMTGFRSSTGHDGPILVMNGCCFIPR